MHVWTLLPKETITDDRAYLIGFLKSVFEAVSLTYLDRTATTVPDPDARPDLILNLVSAKRREALDDIEAKAQRYGVPVFPNHLISESIWRTEEVHHGCSDRFARGLRERPGEGAGQDGEGRRSGAPATGAGGDL